MCIISNAVSKMLIERLGVIIVEIKMTKLVHGLLKVGDVILSNFFLADLQSLDSGEDVLHLHILLVVDIGVLLHLESFLLIHKGIVFIVIIEGPVIRSKSRLGFQSFNLLVSTWIQTEQHMNTWI